METTQQDRLITAEFLVPSDAERAIGALLDHGIGSQQISVASGGRATHEDEETDELLVSSVARRTPRYVNAEGFALVQTEDPPTPGDMNAATEARRGGSSVLSHPDSPIAAQGERGLTTTTAADAAVGAAQGSVFGIGIGLFAGAAALTLPGVGPVLAAGPLWTAMAGLVGTTAAGAAAGSVVGYLKDMGVTPDIAESQSAALRRGSVVVAVHPAPYDNTDTLRALLAKYGGQFV